MAKVKSLEDLMKEGLLKKGSDPSLVIRRISTGLPALDELLGGGIPLGRCIESFGPESTGKTLIAQYMTAAFQRNGKSVLYLDLEHSFDEGWWKQSGVDTENLIVSAPATAEETIDIIMAMLEASEDLGFIVLDSIPGLIPAVEADPTKSADEKTIGLRAKLVTLLYSKTVHILSEKNVTMLVTNQMRDSIGAYDELSSLPGGKAQRHFNSIILRTKRESWITKDKDHIGFNMEITSRKNKTCSVPDGTSIILPFLAAGQIDMATSYIDEAIKAKMIVRRGPYYHWKENSLLGMQALREFFLAHEEEYEELEQLVTA